MTDELQRLRNQRARLIRRQKRLVEAITRLHEAEHLRQQIKELGKEPAVNSSPITDEAAMRPLDKSDPRMVAWETYKRGSEYANTRKWALHEAHVDGSLWAAFIAGMEAARSSAPLQWGWRRWWSG